MLLLIIISLFVLVAVMLTRYFLKRDRGEREPIGMLWVALGLGFVGAISAVILEVLFLPDISDEQMPTAPIVDILVLAMGVGLIEEVCKFVPLALFIYKKRFFNEHTDGVIYFAVAGLGFGVPENILYTLEFGTGAGIVRMILTPFFHAAVTAMVGYYLAKSKLRAGTKLGVVYALLAAIMLHGLYDFGLFSQLGIFVIVSLMITLTFTTTLFLFYIRATERDQALGLSVVGKNDFCRTCGYPNPKRKLYCTRCGRHA